MEPKEGPPQEVRTVVQDLLRAARLLMQYPDGHGIAATAVEAAVASLSRYLLTHNEVAISFSGALLSLNGVDMLKPNAPENRLVPELKKRYIRSIALRRGVTREHVHSLLRVLGEHPDTVRQKGGVGKILAIPEGMGLEVIEMRYDSAVTATEAQERQLIVRNTEGGSALTRPTSEGKVVGEFAQIVDLVDDPENLARLLEDGTALSWLEESEPGDGSTGSIAGIGDASSGPGIGDGIHLEGDGRSFGVLAPEQLSHADAQAQATVLLLMRVRDRLMEDGANTESEVARKLARVVAALDPSFRARLFRTPLEESEAGDLLSQVAQFMSDQELVEAVIPDATVLLEDTSQRTRRALRRCGGKLSGLAPLATERLKEQSLPEQLYTNVVGLIASEMGREDTASGEPVPLSFVGEGKGATAVEIISDLLTTVEAVLAVKARAEVLLELLEKEGDPEVYRSLATSLEPLMKQILDFGFPALAASIVATFQNHLSEPSGPDWRKRRAALALEHMRQTSTLSKVEADLEKATAAEAGPLVFLLCLFGRVGAVRLAGILSDDKQAGLHEAAAEGLANLASEIGDLLPQLTASMPWTASARLAARMATLGDEGALRQVATILKHRDWRVRRAVVEALGEARGRAIDLLIQALGDKDRDVRAVALEHLANIREPASVPALLAMATHGKVGGEDHALRQRAVAALGKIGDPAVPALERILVRRAWIRRKAQEKLSAAAADALAQIGGEQAHAALEHGAASAGGPVQSACVKALATAGSAVSRALERDV